MDNRNFSNAVTNQPVRKNSNQNDLLAKIRPITSNKPNLVQHLARSNPIQISSGLKMLNTRIHSSEDPAYQPLVTISDNDNSDEDDFISPVHKLTKNELREELKSFSQNDNSSRKNNNHALLANDNDNDDDDDTGEIQFRTHPSIKRSVCCYQYPFSLKESLCTIS